MDIPPKVKMEFTQQQRMIIARKKAEEKEAKKLEKKQQKEAEKMLKKQQKEAEKLAKKAEKEAKKLAKKSVAYEDSPLPSPMNTQPPVEMDAREAGIFELAREIYTALGSGHTESVYHCAMKVGLHDMALKFETERDLPVTFRGRYVGTVRADLVVENSLVIELKITGKIEDAEDQCRQYMKLTGIQRGLVILFPKRDENLIVFRCVKA
jgi:GxxExxY protein